MTVLIAGAGIAGLTLGLTLHQIGVPFRIFEAVDTIRPLGVGINLQPNAVRELYDLDLKDALESTGVATRSLGFYSKTGREIWTEPRGLHAGYNWPQYSIHRGKLQMLLHDALIQRAGENCIVTGHRVKQASETGELYVEHIGGTKKEKGAIVIGADGIHSATRSQLVPQEGAPLWAGAILWRGVTRMPPFLSGKDMILAGHDTLRIVAYPISKADPETGLADVNWIAERRVDPAQGWRREDWNRPADLADFAPAFRNWRFDWLDVPEMIGAAERVYEYPMVDREPLERWTRGRITLMGDAAHPTYPVGSNGASQAIVDARILGAVIAEHGPTPVALEAYEAQVRPRTTQVTLANRGSGPDAILQQVEDLCAGEFDKIDDVLPHDVLAAHAEKYKALAGFGIEALNAQPALVHPNHWKRG